MKQILALLLTLILLFSLSACEKGGTTSELNTSPTTDQDAQEVLNPLNASEKFVVDEELKNLNAQQLSLPLGNRGVEEKANIQQVTITKSKILDINKTEDFDYDYGNYEFYKYQYTIKVLGNIDSKHSGKYIRLKFYFPNATMKIRTFFKGEIGGLGSFSYSPITDLTDTNGCVCKVENDGSFKGEITSLSNENINEYMITGIGFADY